jgi:hypothetical protein
MTSDEPFEGTEVRNTNKGQDERENHDRNYKDTLFRVGEKKSDTLLDGSQGTPDRPSDKSRKKRKILE